MTPQAFRAMALLLPDAIESSHMGHQDFRVRGKVFATIGYPNTTFAVIMLTSQEQARQGRRWSIRPREGRLGPERKHERTPETCGSGAREAGPRGRVGAQVLGAVAAEEARSVTGNLECRTTPAGGVPIGARDLARPSTRQRSTDNMSR